MRAKRVGFVRMKIAGASWPLAICCGSELNSAWWNSWNGRGSLITKFPYRYRTGERLSRAERALRRPSAVSTPLIIGVVPISRIQMLHPNNPAHFVEKFFSHDEIPNRINAIKAGLGQNDYRKTDLFGVGKPEKIARKMPHIAQVRKGRGRKNSNLRSISGNEAGIKKQLARILDKKSYCHRLYS